MRSRTAVASVVFGALAFGGIVLACSSDRPPPSPAITDAGGDAFRPSFQPADAADADAATCSACGLSKCAAVESACAADAVCASCFDSGVPACFSNAAFGAVVDCTCTTCASDCAGTCPSLSCARCVDTSCRVELEQCLADPACKPCTLPDPPPSCGTNAKALAAFSCSCAHCKGQGCDTSSCP